MKRASGHAPLCVVGRGESRRSTVVDVEKLHKQGDGVVQEDGFTTVKEASPPTITSSHTRGDRAFL